jgi:hypothetical protein
MNQSYAAIALICGMLFGFWPILMSRSGFQGFASSAVYSCGVFLFVLLPALIETKVRGGVGDVRMWLASLAILCGATGLLMFTTGLAKLPREHVPTFVLLNILAQITVLAAIDAYYAGGLRGTKIAGVALAAVAAYLLFRK